MSRPVDIAAELLSLEAELQELEQAEESLPCGAHIHALLQLAIERVEERMSMLQRVRVVGVAQRRPSCDAAA
jgi:hypothetical protein